MTPAVGDGTISEAARCLAYRDMALGIVPLGTTNNFARTLGIPLDVPGAIGVLATGKVADVDLGKAGEAIFARLVEDSGHDRTQPLVLVSATRYAGWSWPSAARNSSPARSGPTGSTSKAGTPTCAG